MYMKRNLKGIEIFVLLNGEEAISPVYTRLLTRVGIRVKLIRVRVDTPNPDSNPG